MKQTITDYMIKNKGSIILILGLIIVTRILDTFVVISFARQFQDQTTPLLKVFIVFTIIICVISFKFMQNLLSIKLGVMTQKDLTKRILTEYSNSNVQVKQKYSLSDFHQIVNKDVVDVTSFFSDFLISIISSIIFFIVVTIYVFISYGLIGYLFTLIILNMTIVLSIMGKKMGKRWIKKKKHFVELANTIEDASYPTQDIKQFYTSYELKKNLNQKLFKFFKADFSATLGGYHLWVFSLIFMSFGKILILIIGIYFYLNDQLSFSQLFGLVMVFDLLEETIMYVRYQLEDMPVMRAAMTRIQNFRNELDVLGFGTDMIEQLNEISIKNYRIHHQNTSSTCNDMTIKNNGWCQIKGQSGSGKTTLLYCLLNLINHQPMIYFNNQHNAMLSRDWYQQNVLYFNQNMDLSYTTARHYILGDNDVTDLTILEHILPFTVQWDSVMSEDAQQLSSGEIQFLILCKALVTKASIIVIDEATSYLDDQNEDLFFELMLKMNKEVFLFFVSHKIRNFDCFNYVIDIEKGVSEHYE